MSKKLLDLETGYIHFHEEKVVKKDDSLESVQSLKLGIKSNLSDMKTGWIWLDESEVPFNEDLLYIRFAFFKNKLKKVQFDIYGCYPSTTEPGGKPLTEEESYKKYEEYKSWIEKNIGESGYYDWGGFFATHSRGHEFNSLIHIDYIKSKRLPDESLWDWEKRMKKQEEEELS